MSGLQLPEALLRSLEEVAGFDREAFLAVHASGEQVPTVRIHPHKFPAVPEEYTSHLRGEPVPWSTMGRYLRTRPVFTLDPLLHAGAFYVQEASGMFLETCLRQILPGDRPLRVLDLCAAPGGKSTLLLALLPPGSVLVSNEVIRSRVPILTENLIKWGMPNVVVTSHDPVEFGRLPGFFDLILVDAPCSGSGLFRRDPELMSTWSPEAVVHCRKRQERILRDVLPALRQGGMLVYSTCSYSPLENEGVAQWLIDHGGMEPVTLDIDPSWGLAISDEGPPAYRFFPHRLKGEGFFLACFRNFRQWDPDPQLRPARRRDGGLHGASAREALPWRRFLREDAGLRILKNAFRRESFFAFPSESLGVLELIHGELYPKYAGVELGRLAGSEAVPAHALALLHTGVQGVSVSLKMKQALSFLRCADTGLSDLPGPSEGWTRAEFGGLGLGWMKRLGRRTNNYYPRAWRIRMEAPERAE